MVYFEANANERTPSLLCQRDGRGDAEWRESAGECEQQESSSGTSNPMRQLLGPSRDPSNRVKPNPRDLHMPGWLQLISSPRPQTGAQVRFVRALCRERACSPLPNFCRRDRSLPKLSLANVQLGFNMAWCRTGMRSTVLQVAFGSPKRGSLGRDASENAAWPHPTSAHMHPFA